MSGLSEPRAEHTWSSAVARILHGEVRRPQAVDVLGDDPAAASRDAAHALVTALGHLAC
jgi:hypothetical protein